MISVIIKSGNVLHSLAPTSFAPSAHEAFPVELVVRRRDKMSFRALVVTTIC